MQMNANKVQQKQQAVIHCPDCTDIQHVETVFDFTWLLDVAPPVSMIPPELLLSPCSSCTQEMGLLWLAEKLMTALIGCSSVLTMLWTFFALLNWPPHVCIIPLCVQLNPHRFGKIPALLQVRFEFWFVSPLSVSVFCYTAVMLHDNTTLLCSFSSC